MPKKMSLKQIEANRRNARKSTGPRTAAGRAVSRLNAVKHGILSREVLVRGVHGRESSREFTALHQRFTADLQPAGPVEEMLVDQIVTTHWRLRRALTAEAGEIALSVDGGQWQRQRGPHPQLRWLQWEALGDPVHSMEDSAMGCALLERWLREVRARVEQDGELTEAATQIPLNGRPNSLSQELERLRLRLRENPEGLEEAAWRERNRQAVLAQLDRKLRTLHWCKNACERREQAEEQAQQAAAALPALPALDKILRYESKLERQLYRALAQLERLQRMRRGEAVPAPLTVEVSERA